MNVVRLSPTTRQTTRALQVWFMVWENCNVDLSWICLGDTVSEGIWQQQWDSEWHYNKAQLHLKLLWRPPAWSQSWWSCHPSQGKEAGAYHLLPWHQVNPSSIKTQHSHHDILPPPAAILQGSTPEATASPGQSTRAPASSCCLQPLLSLSWQTETLSSGQETQTVSKTRVQHQPRDCCQGTESWTTHQSDLKPSQQPSPAQDWNQPTVTCSRSVQLWRESQLSQEEHLQSLAKLQAGGVQEWCPGLQQSQCSSPGIQEMSLWGSQDSAGISTMAFSGGLCYYGLELCKVRLQRKLPKSFSF